MTSAGPRGLFIKTPAPQIVELVALERPDFAVIDAEHAPFDRGMIDLMMLAGRSAGLPLYVRVQDANGSSIGSALDCGAAGVIVPHVSSVDEARGAVAKAKYIGGRRGFSSAPRHAGYGSGSMCEVVAVGDSARVIVQVEDPGAAEHVQEILDVDGVDGILVGRADLAIAMGETDTSAVIVAEMVSRIFGSVSQSTKIKGVVVSSEAERQSYAQLGANWFIMGNDQGLLRKAVRQLLSA